MNIPKKLGASQCLPGAGAGVGVGGTVVVTLGESVVGATVVVVVVVELGEFVVGLGVGPGVVGATVVTLEGVVGATVVILEGVVGATVVILDGTLVVMGIGVVEILLFTGMTRTKNISKTTLVWIYFNKLNTFEYQMYINWYD